MKYSILKTTSEFRLYWKNYLLQSLFAALAIFLVLIFLSLEHAVIIGSLEATIVVIVTSIILSLIHVVFKHHLRDLL